MNHMNRLFQAVPVLVLCIALAGCAAPISAPSPESAAPAAAEPDTAEREDEECVVPCISVDDQTLGTPYPPGSFFVESGVVVISQYFDAGSGMAPGNGITIHGPSDGEMEGNTSPYLWTNNANAAFVFPCPLTGLSFRFADHGGNINLMVNGDQRVEQDLPDVISPIGDVEIAVELDPNITSHMSGAVTLTGTIESFSVGGQELAIDEVCPE